MKGMQSASPIFLYYMEFKIFDNLKFVNVDIEFLKKLHNVSSEVYYHHDNYDKKPYLGLLISTNNYKYVIPLTSGKEKHKKWKDEENDRFLITEIIEKNKLDKDDIWVDYIGESKLNHPIKHIISAIDLKKMIPIVDSVITMVDIVHKEDDDIATKKYKDLLNKEYRFCIGILDKILKKASSVYDKQTKTKKGIKFCCDLKTLEKFIDNY